MNRLASQKSPYLLQHAANPVDWHPWGDEAFRKAISEDKPVFLSIGYSTCHWCHVMERESFEDPEVAALMNETFVCIKVDREERPDLDDYYMTACQVLTGTGGWPLTIVMTPERLPFFAATYVPKATAYGRQGMRELVPRIHELWKTRRPDILSSADTVARELRKAESQPEGAGAELDTDVVTKSATAVSRLFDRENGGFGTAPKFPMPTVFPLLMRSWKRNADAGTLGMAERTLVSMRNGGIFDQVGFGFHRYSTDAEWLVPHFEKMLYDQALLSIAYVEAWQATGNDFYKRTALEIFTYVLRDMTSPGGAFFCAEDADSEGEEGKFYLWSTEEIRELLGAEEFLEFSRIYDLKGKGSFAGLHVLYREASETAQPGFAEEKVRLAREARIHPFKDDKVLADWNGLMIAALARAGGAFNESRFTQAAARAVDFVLDRMVTRDGRLLHRYRGGEAAIPAFADDYAFIAWGLLELYEASFDSRYIGSAIALMNEMVEDFWDSNAGGFFQTADDAEEGTLPRRKSFADSVLPSANSAALLVLSRLALYTGDLEYRRKAETIARLAPRDIVENPISHGFFLSALDFILGPSFSVVIVGDPFGEDVKEMIRELRRRFIPNKVVMFRSLNRSKTDLAGLAPFTSSLGGTNWRATAYVCRDQACDLPTNDVRVMLQQLGES